MENEGLYERNSIFPVLLSLFVGFVVVLLISGLVVNYVGKLRNDTQVAQQEEVVEKVTEEEKVGFFDRIKNALSFGKNDDEPTVTVTPAPNDDVAMVMDNEVEGLETAGLDSSTMTEFFNFVGLSGMTGLNDGKGKGEVYTVVVPSNTAFEANQEAINILVDRGNQSEIQSLIKRHIVRGKLTNGGAAQTVSGESLFIDLSQNTVTFGGITANIVQRSGDTVVIDRVLY